MQARVDADAIRRQHVKWPRDAERTIRCWCVVSVRQAATVATKTDDP